MNNKAIATLEYHTILKQLEERAASGMGKRKCQEALPMSDIADITKAQSETTFAANLITRKGSLPLGGLTDFRPALRRALAGGMLSPEELFSVSDGLYVCRKVINYGNELFNESEIKIPLSEYFTCITLVSALEDEIVRCINPSGEINDNASPKLSGIRRAVRVQHDRIRDQLQSIIHSQANKNMLQDAIVTIRGGRFCVPVKADQRANFPGMVHDQSSTGATVFMEPLSVVELNNKIKDLHFEEKREEERILFKLSDMVAQNGEVLDANISILAHLDFVFAKGELSCAMEASEPLFNDKGFVNIRKGRHPLLNKDKVVPTDIILGGDFHMLLITGPNTGGKTVTLKTLGLFHLMGLSGLHIPAAGGSELAVFNEIFADIGDEQSIEQSLSTFSSHMSNIVNILKDLDYNDLVLLDELGAGTDPTEGAALAISLLNYLHERGIRTVVTTHYSELKQYALGTLGAENASCEFDVVSLQPTYRLLIGIPGKSNAFAIAKRLGLPDNIIEDAKLMLSQKDVRFEDVITDLEASKKLMLLEQEKAEALRTEAANLGAQVKLQEQKLASQREKILQEAKEDAMTIVQQAKRESDKLIKEMRNQIDRANQRDLEEALNTARTKLAEMEAGIKPAATEKAKHKPPENLKKGDRVLIHSMNQHGTVSEVPDSGGEVLLQAGIMKIKVHISDLSMAENEVKSTSKVKSHGGGNIAKALSVSHEIHLRGMMPEEALILAEKYLDDAFLSGLREVRIVHGKGQGVLKTVIQNMLKKHPHVSEYRLGRFGEGETGVTVVTLV